MDIGGNTLLERTLRAFGAAGIDECVVVTGYLHRMIEEAAASYHLPLRVRFANNELYETTNNNYSLWLAGRVTADSGILMMDADILFEPRLLNTLIDSPYPDALIIREGKMGKEEIKVELDGGRVRRIGKEIDPPRAAGESIGIEKFSPKTACSLFSILDRRKDRYEFYEASFQELIDQGADLRTVSSGTMACMEIDTPEDLQEARILARSISA